MTAAKLREMHQRRKQRGQKETVRLQADKIVA
jgi:hypothetical protein